MAHTKQICASTKPRICSYCNSDDGHNKATCEVRWQLFGFLMDDPVASKPIRECNYCACAGHDKRNCFLFLIATNMFDEESPKTPTAPRVDDYCSVTRRLFCETPVAQTTARRTAMHPIETHRSVQVTQVIDMDIYDEPWVWAPVRPNKWVRQPTAIEVCPGSMITHPGSPIV
jgi:hypothetical protein